MRAVLVPVKSFNEAKLRLAGTLDDDARRNLAKALAAIVLRAAESFPRFVACDDDEVAEWAISEGAQVLWTAKLGLSGAATAGVAKLAQLGFDLVIVSHGDLPLVQSFEQFGVDDAITLAPDRRLDGTNVAAVPSRAGFNFSYGPGSFHRHRDEASRLGLAQHTVHDWRLACDLDVPADLERIGSMLGDLIQRPVSPV